MKKIKEIPKLNINTNYSKKASNLSYHTPRNNSSRSIIFSQRNIYSLTSYNNFPPTLFSPCSYNYSPKKTSRANNIYNNTNSFVNNNIFFSYKILNVKDYVLNERLKTSSTRYTEHTLNKDKTLKLYEKLEKNEKIKFKKIKIYIIHYLIK